jgi:hypothetical protein
MPDLTTPLLDTVHKKLNDKRMSCKTLEYDPFSFSGYSVGEPISMPGGSLNRTDPTEPPTVSPTAPLVCPDGYTGMLAYGVCNAYYTCVFGTPVYPAVKCPGECIVFKF